MHPKKWEKKKRRWLNGPKGKRALALALTLTPTPTLTLTPDLTPIPNP